MMATRSIMLWGRLVVCPFHWCAVPRTNRNITPVCWNSSYKAAVLYEFGKPLQLDEVKRQKKLAGDEVRVNVFNCAVNVSDILLCEGKYEPSRKLPFVPGFEICGEVTDTGSKVSTLRKGDRVIGLNKRRLSGFAEECISGLQDLWHIPHTVQFEEGASLVDSYATALIGLSRRADIQEGDTVLITAAAGGLGLAAVDLAANVYKAKVVGVCGTEDKASLVREKGAWASVSYHDKNIHKKVKDMTDGKGVKILFDAVGGDIFKECLKSVSHEGKVIVAGFASQKVPQIMMSELLPQSVSVIGVSLSRYSQSRPDVYRQAVQDVIDMCEEDLVSPHVSAHFQLADVNEAFKFLQDRKSTGKVLLDISGSF